MSNHRLIESDLLGYRIDRIRHFDDQGLMSSQWYEVLTPDATVLGHFAHRSEAERAVIARELSAAPRIAAA